MILEVKTVQVERTSPRARKVKQLIVYRCDQCGKTYEGKYQKKYLSNREFHLCSYECMGVSRSRKGVACEYQVSRRDIPKWSANIKKAIKERYGVENVSSLDWVKQKKIETSQVHYGVDYPVQHPEIKRRSIETHSFHGRNWMSKPEKEFRVILENEFGKDDVKVQQLIERKWSIDFYIKSINTYVSFDGVYWHGLDRDINEIRKSIKSRDQAIYGKWLKDRELDAYVSENNMKLVRITDQEFKSDLRSCLFRIRQNNG